MRKASTTLMLAIFSVMTMLMTVACNVNDYPVSNKNAAPDVSGMWWAYYDSNGTFGDAPYTHVGQALCLNADGKGYAVTFYYNDKDEEPVAIAGGNGVASLIYDVDADGNVTFSMPKAYQPCAEYYGAWTIKCVNSSLNCTVGKDDFLMLPATDDRRMYIVKYDLMANGGNSGDSPVKSIENDGESYVMDDYHFTLNNQIDKATGSDPDVLNQSGSISLEFKVSPVYIQSSNGSKAGDYYFVTCAVTPHNNNLWAPFIGSHGWTRNRVYGYWFKEMDLAVDLVNADGSKIEGLRYYERPIPENQNDSRSYTNGKTINIGGTLSAGASEKQGLNAGLGFSVGASWTSSSSYTLTTVNYKLDTSSPTVKYNYYTSNVKLKDDWDNMEDNFPTACHTEFTGRSYWVWFVPYDESGKKGVCDGLDKRFRLKASVAAVYSSWYHWRGTATFDGNRKDYDNAKFETNFLLSQPDRTPWGYVALKNAMSSEMAHVKFFRSGEESKDPVATVNGSFAKNQVAKTALPEGTYTVTFDQMNPDTNQVLSRWTIKNLKVHQGRDEVSAKLDVSTVDAQKVE